MLDKTKLIYDLRRRFIFADFLLHAFCLRWRYIRRSSNFAIIGGWWQWRGCPFLLTPNPILSFVFLLLFRRTSLRLFASFGFARRVLRMLRTLRLRRRWGPWARLRTRLRGGWRGLGRGRGRSPSCFWRRCSSPGIYPLVTGLTKPRCRLGDLNAQMFVKIQWSK